MQPGEVLSGRFELERRAGSGGMGEVFKAHDRARNEAVAVKVLVKGRTPDHQRFAREADVLAELSHPGIVRYVAHGLGASGEPYLAMEWLEGEDLGERIKRCRFAVDEAILLGQQVAQALTAAHARGVVHRDLKPSNLFLVGSEVGQVKVLDFGLARSGGATPMTKAGMLLGTPGYMAPEQVRSGGDIDARADVFALGCVLFECLSGAPLFTGEHFVAILAKILFQEAPRLRDQAPDIPPALDALIARMLKKNREERPRDSASVAEALAALGVDTTLDFDVEARSSRGPASALTGSERRVMSIVLLAPERELDEGALAPGRAEAAGDTEALSRTVEAHGGRLEVLTDGSAIVRVGGATRIATDQAAQAARCALGLRALYPERPMALSTGRAQVTGQRLLGTAIDRAARMLSSLAREGQEQPLIAIDEVTAGLLDARFEVVERPAGLVLRGEHALVEGARTLLGKATACVGRDWELSILDSLLSGCIEDSAARAVLVTAPAGMGKSRIAYELMGRARRRVEAVAVWIGRGDSLQAGSTFGLLAQALRGALGIREGEPLDVRRQKLLGRVGEHRRGSEQRRVSEFLGELIGTPFSEDESVSLRAARQDAHLMGDQMRRAWLDFVEAETSAHPVLLVLEDLHWGDLPTVRFIDAALRDMRGKPWMVLALGRPGVHDVFPKLWADRKVQEIRLTELSRKASERLVQQVLGEDISGKTMEHIVTQAEGNAFYLEELIRAVAEDTDAGLPETVLAMAESRLQGLTAEARRILRAASVFGEVFWQSGVTHLLGGTTSLAKVSETLGVLALQEVLVRRPESRFSGDAEFAFRQSLLREVAYAMLTDSDRALGHQLAGEWIEGTGSTDALTLAEHFSRGGELGRAVRWFRSAAEQALEADDLRAVLELAERGVESGASGEDLGALRLVEAEAHAWRGNLALSEERGVEAIELLSAGSVLWFKAIRQTIIAAGKQGSAERVERWVHMARTAARSADALGAFILCLSEGATQLIFCGLYAGAHALMEVLVHDAPSALAEGPQIAAMLHQMRAFHASAAGDIGACLEALKTALSAFEQAGDLRNACVTRANLGFIYAELGDFEGAERVLSGAGVTADRMGLYDVSAAVSHNLGSALAHLGRFDEARLLEERALEAYRRQGDPRMEGSSRRHLAQIGLLVGDHGAAESDARAAVELLIVAPPLRAVAAAILARALLCQGRTSEALAAASDAFATLEALGALEEDESLVRLVYAEALDAAGQREQARASIIAARARLLSRADKIGDLGYRKSFLEDVPANARTLALVREWLAEDGNIQR